MQAHTWEQGVGFRSRGSNKARNRSTFGELEQDPPRGHKTQSRDINLEKSVEADGEVRAKERIQGTLTYGCHLKPLEQREKGVLRQS